MSELLWICGSSKKKKAMQTPTHVGVCLTNSVKITVIKTTFQLAVNWLFDPSPLNGLSATLTKSDTCWSSRLRAKHYSLWSNNSWLPHFYALNLNQLSLTTYCELHGDQLGCLISVNVEVKCKLNMKGYARVSAWTFNKAEVVRRTCVLNSGTQTDWWELKVIWKRVEKESTQIGEE